MQESAPIEPGKLKQFFECVSAPPTTTSTATIGTSGTKRLLLQLAAEADPSLQRPSPDDAKGGEQRPLLASPELLIPGIDRVLESFRRGDGLILPRTELLNEMLRVYIEGGCLDKVQALVSQMTSTFGVQPNRQTAELVALAYARSGNTKVALKMLDLLPTVGEGKQRSAVHLSTDPRPIIPL